MKSILTNNQILTLGNEVIYNKNFLKVKKEWGITEKKAIEIIL